MRSLLFVLAVVLLSCESAVEPDSRLLDSWQWVSSSGGFAGTMETPASTGEEVMIEFTAKKFRKYVNGSLTEELGYKVKLEESIYSTEPEEVINYSNGWRQSYLIKDDTLYLSDQCYDCYGYIYVKN
jgi:hypothetical protein